MRFSFAKENETENDQGKDDETEIIQTEKLRLEKLDEMRRIKVN